MLCVIICAPQRFFENSCHFFSPTHLQTKFDLFIFIPVIIITLVISTRRRIQQAIIYYSFRRRDKPNIECVFPSILHIRHTDIHSYCVYDNCAFHVFYNKISPNCQSTRDHNMVSWKYQVWNWKSLIDYKNRSHSDYSLLKEK